MKPKWPADVKPIDPATLALGMTVKLTPQAKRKYCISEIQGSLINIGKIGNGIWTKNDALYDPFDCNAARLAAKKKSRPSMMDKIIAIMEDRMPRTSAELATLLNTHESTVCCVLGRLRCNGMVNKIPIKFVIATKPQPQKPQ